MAVIELEPEKVESTEFREDTTENQEIHLFNILGETACGVPAEDWHLGIHGVWIPWGPGVNECPTCGIPVCADCQYIAGLIAKENT